MAVAVAIRVSVPATTGASGLSTDAVVPLLMAGAALCVLGLTVVRRPGVAWLAIVAVLAIVTIDVATTLRAQATPLERTVGAGWPSALCLVAIGAVAAACAYAAAPGRRLGPWLPIAGGLALAWMLGASGWALAGADPGGDRRVRRLAWDAGHRDPLDARPDAELRGARAAG